MASTQSAHSRTADAQQPEEADKDAYVGVHQAERDHGNALSDDKVDEKVAAVGYGSPNEGRDLPCRDQNGSRRVMLEGRTISRTTAASGERVKMAVCLHRRRM